MLSKLMLTLLVCMGMTGCDTPPTTSDTPATPSVSDPSEEQPSEEAMEGESAADQTITLDINGTEIPVQWEENRAVEDLKALLADGELTIQTQAYGGFEQVGSLPKSLTADNAQVTTEPGDIVLYNGNSIVLFYGSNSWSYTKLGHMTDFDEATDALLRADTVTITLSLA